MHTIRRSSERGHFNHGWLDTYHTFSFADYYDPEHMNFRSLRVMNEDRVAAGQGFGMHPHRDMEIITVVLSGALEHRDSLGSGEVLRPGEVQRMSAGNGILHSEFNPSPNEPVHLYQIWIMPNKKGIRPEYEQRPFSEAARSQGWQRVASATGRDGAMTIHQDAEILLTSLAEGAERKFELAPGRHAWLQVMRGKVSADGLNLSAGDGFAISSESQLSLRGIAASEVMLFDLA